jgi:hypothetical protein
MNKPVYAPEASIGDRVTKGPDWGKAPGYFTGHYANVTEGTITAIGPNYVDQNTFGKKKKGTIVYVHWDNITNDENLGLGAGYYCRKRFQALSYATNYIEEIDKALDQLAEQLK